ncbi:hypothetical protein HYQ45_016200 [Verticillium longisporum]|uniref:Uncharacterized protein n=1 Tax=Verticillium longisporum TaxID=100787 RepID=A0A8I3AJE3_VERLO|nr:hypothetical protein HYQ45_016200 [Verticillium longisporum]
MEALHQHQCQYLAAKSGNSNVYTGPTSTNYDFEMFARRADDEKPTEENPSALTEVPSDVFAQLSIEPLLASTPDRELRAVDSEASYYDGFYWVLSPAE